MILAACAQIPPRPQKIEAKKFEPGKLYFVEQWVTGWRGSVTNSRPHQLDQRIGRQMVRTSTLCCSPN